MICRYGFFAMSQLKTFKVSCMMAFIMYISFLSWMWASVCLYILILVPFCVVWDRFGLHLKPIWTSFWLKMELQNDLGTKMEPERSQACKMWFFRGSRTQNPTSNFHVFPTMYLNSVTFWACDLQVRFLCDFLWIPGPSEGWKSCKPWLGVTKSRFRTFIKR